MNVLKLEKYCENKNVTHKGAFPDNTVIKYALYVPRKFGAYRVSLVVDGDNFSENTAQRSYDFQWTDLIEDSDLYECELDLTELETGLYFVNAEIDNGKEKICYYGDNNYHKQLLVFSHDFDTPVQENTGIIYHIFVDRFYSSGKSKPKKGTIIDKNWENGIPQYGERPGAYVENNVFFGGDLYGVAEKMDYISKLGVKYIYLSPIFDAYSNHKYDTGDYMKVDDNFGGDKALKCLIEKADEYGIKIILDGVFNHTGCDSKYFNKYGKYDSVGAYNSEESPYFQWYNFRNFPNDYESWWNIEILPRVKSYSPDYINFITGKDGVVEKWGNFGIGGWRLDVADELADEFLDEFRKKVKAKNKNALIIGEVWENASNKISYSKRRKYFQGKQIDSVMNYPIREAIIFLLKYRDTELFIETLKELTYCYPDRVLNCLMNLLSTHDTERLITALVGKKLDNDNNEKLANTSLNKKEFYEGVRQVKLAYTLLYFLPGMPSLFYGDEIGMEGYHDPFCRRPFKWSRTENNAMLEYFIKLGSIKKNCKALSDGELKICHYNEEFFVLERFDEKEKAIFILNYSENSLLVKGSRMFKNLLIDKENREFTIKKGGFLMALTDSKNDYEVSIKLSLSDE